MMIKRIGQFINNIGAWFSIIAIAIIALLNIIFTVCYSTPYSFAFTSNNYIIAIMGASIGIIMLPMIQKINAIIERIGFKRLIIIGFMFSFIMSMIWLIMSGYHPEDDSTSILRFDWSIIDNNDDWRTTYLKYMERYQYQSGVGLIMYPFALLSHAIGRDIWFAYGIMMTLNTLWTATIIPLIGLITKEIKNDKAGCAAILLSMGFIVIPMSAIQVYGNTLSVPLILLALLTAIRLMKSFNLRNAIIIMLVAIILGFIKPNNMIIGIAITIILIVCSMIRINWKHAITGIIIIPFMMIGAALAPALLQGITGVDYNENMKAPAKNFMIMGLNDDAAGGYGFFKWNIGSTRYTLDESNRNADNTWRKQSVKFKQPSYLIDFFRVKTMETWAEPTFSYVTRPAESYYYSEYVKQNSIDNDDKDGIVENAKEPVLHETIGQKIIDSNVFMIITRSWLDGLCILISSFAIIGIMRNRHDAYGILLGVCILGGFLFHLIWETKPEYAYTYFILLIPYAAMITNDFSIDNIAGKNNDKKSLIKSFQHD